MLVLDKWTCVAASMASLFADFVYKKLKLLEDAFSILHYIKLIGRTGGKATKLKNKRDRYGSRSSIYKYSTYACPFGRSR